MTRWIDFSDVRPNFNAERNNVFIGFLLGTILLGVFNNFPQYASAATVFFIMLIVWGVGTIFEVVSKRGDLFVDAIGVGKNYWLAMTIGAAIGFLGVTAARISAPLPFAVTGIDAFSFFFVVITAPFVEANFFRGLFMPWSRFIFQKKLKLGDLISGFAAIVFQAAVFAWFHWFVLGGNLAALQATFLFGLVAGVGVYAFRSVTFEYGLHGVNNLLVFMGGV